METEVEEPLRKEQEEQEEGEQEAVEAVAVAAKERNDRGKAEHEGGTDEGDGEAGEEGEEPDADEGEEGGKKKPPATGTAGRKVDEKIVERIENGEVETGESEQMTGSAFAVELAGGAVECGAIAECHGGEQCGGVPIEMLMVLGDEVRAGDEKLLAKGEFDGEMRELPIAGVAMGTARDALSAQVGGAVGLAGVARIGGRGDARVDEEMSANLKTTGGERRGGTEGGVGQREFDEATFVRVGRDESAFGIPLSGGNVGSIAHHGEMGTGLALVGKVEATAIVVEKGETEQEGGEGDADGGENGRRGAAEKE